MKKNIMSRVEFLELNAFHCAMNRDLFCAGHYFCMAGLEAKKQNETFKAAIIFKMAGDVFTQLGDVDGGACFSYIEASTYYAASGEIYLSILKESQNILWLELSCSFYQKAIDVLERYNGYNAKVSHKNLIKKYKKILNTIQLEIGVDYNKKNQPNASNFFNGENRVNLESKQPESEWKKNYS